MWEMQLLPLWSNMEFPGVTPSHWGGLWLEMFKNEAVEIWAVTMAKMMGGGCG